jgi:CheY-like chemotaxis protein
MAKRGPLAMPVTVLVAEDSADTRAVLRHSLASCGYHVVEAADG